MDGSSRLSISALALTLAVSLLVGCDRESGTGASDSRIEERLKAKDWHVRQKLATELCSDHSRRSFAALLQLLNDRHEDVSHAASEGIELRGDKEYAHDFFEAIARLPRERRWAAYRALKNYPTIETLRFLAGALNEEFEHYRGSQTFDDRNCHYIAKSIEELATKVLGAEVTLKAPLEGGHQSFAQFLVQANAAIAKGPISQNQK